MPWHYWISRELASYGDDLLEALAQKQRDFDQLLAEREAIYQHWSAYVMQYDAANRQCQQIPEYTPFWRIAQIWDPPDYVGNVFMHDIYESSRA